MVVDVLSPDEAVDCFVGAALAGQSGYCVVPNVHQCVYVHDHAEFRARVNAAALVVTDSTILQRAIAWRLGRRLAAPMRGAELMMAICRRAQTYKIPIALVGGRDGAALALLVERLKRELPLLQIAYTYSPPFRPLSFAEDREVINGLRASGARICFVGLGCPKQENWMADHSPHIRGMLIGVGAAFDANAGLIKSSPNWVHRAGFDWLMRLLAEPRRLWHRYATTSPRFIWLLALEAFRKRQH